ncbi:P-loop NTPase fold protein [Enterococcus canintestini]|uniref:KAP family P-loop NTPase fold protein n=2 Tax=Enterococcus canintestini TaxID=317010 RepID=UPI0039953579
MQQAKSPRRVVRLGAKPFVVIAYIFNIIERGFFMGNKLKSIKSKWDDYRYFYSRKYSFINSFIVSAIIASGVIFLDYNNYLSNFFLRISSDTCRTLLFLIILFCVLLLIKFRFFKMLIHPLLNKVDQMVLILIFSIFIWLLSTLTNYSNMTTKLIYAQIMISILIVVFVVRFYFQGKRDLSKKSTIIDLKEVLDGKVNFDKHFLLRESAVDYDLLNRSRLINDLAELLKGYTSEERFVIGIEGKWGSGKTTLLRNLISSISDQEDMIVIDDFEPWLSENKESLLRNLLKKILRQSNLEIPDKEIDMLISSIIKNVLGKDYVNSVMDLIENPNDEKISLVLNDINYMIRRNDKKIIFTIDNLDRLSPENVFLILNIVNNILDFNNLIVILSYDKDEIDKGLKSINVSPAYLNKLVQKRIVLPLINEEDLFSIYCKSLVSLLEGKKIEFEHTEIASFAKIFSDHQIGLREFKNFVNSIVIPYINNPKKISLVDYLAIEYIRTADYPMFDLIYTKRDYFISIDQPMIVSLSFLNSDEFDKKMNDFFDKLSFKSEVIKELLMLIFPNLTTYFESKRNYRHAVSTNKNDTKYRLIQKNKKICSGKFFDLYFTHEKNLDSVMIDSVSMFVEELNQPDVEILQVDNNLNALVSLAPEKQTLFFTTLSIYVEELLPRAQELLSLGLLERHRDFGNYSTFFSLGTQDRIAVIVSELLQNLSYDSSVIIVSELFKSPKNLSFISRIIYWLENDRESDNSKLVEYLDQNFAELIAEVLNGKYNIFDKELYYKGNSHRVLWRLKDQGKIEEFKKYIENNISKENVYRVLNDFISSGSGTAGYTYKMTDNYQDYIDSSILEKLLMQRPPRNEKQKLLKEIFDNQLIGISDDFGDISIRRESPIDLTNVDE